MERLQRERSSLEKKLLSLSPLLEGSLITRRIHCGRPRCRCASGDLHGPYYYLSKKVRGETQMIYLTNQRHLIDAAERYREYQKGLTRIREIGRMIEGLLQESRDKKLLRKI